jgi:glucose/arabinose dehydrogenase
VVARCTLLAAVALAVLAVPARADTVASGGLSLTKLGDFSEPTYVASPPDDPSRIFVVQKSGEIHLVRDDVRLGDPFLIVPNVHNEFEQGLLSMAFAPDYATSGVFYVAYNDATSCEAPGGDHCDVRIDEFHRFDADHADTASRRTVLTVDHRDTDSHNGGQLQFGPDGYLYASIGDGGTTGAPSQDTGSLLGKILRIDPRQSGSDPYTSPASNPFAGGGGRPEVFDYGLRNPWRFSFDALTGDLLVADVGQGRREEVNVHPAGTAGGANFGWNVCEGELKYPDDAPCPGSDVPGYVPPAFTYPHADGRCSIVGGYVVRQPAVPELDGRYVYGDYCDGILRSRSLSLEGDTPVGSPSAPLQVDNLSSFGQDSLCRVYVVSIGGPVYRLDRAATAAGCQPASAAASGGPPSASPADTPPMQLTSLAAVARVPPVLSNLTMLRLRFAVSRGTAFRFTLSKRAAVAFGIYRLLPGRRVGRLCRPLARGSASARRCTRVVHRGTFTRTLDRGRRSTPFSGRIGGAALVPGAYRAVLRASDRADGASPPRSIDFAVVRG